MKIWISAFLILASVAICKASWGTPGLGQYHIQTDEGPERYFRFQTDNGQYRKEKRLQDGTVIGTDAWIDDAGVLRSKDYIADKQGYRILKSKTIYVGKGRPIEEAMNSIKNIPAQSGILSNPDQLKNVLAITTYRPATLYSTATPSSTTSTTPIYIPVSTTTSSPFLGYHYSGVTPQVYIRHHSQPLEEELAFNSLNDDFPSSTLRPIVVPSSTYEAHHFSNDDRSQQLKPIAVISSTPAPISSTEASSGSNSNNYYPQSTSSSPPTYFSPTSPPSPFSSTAFPQTTYHPQYSTATASPLEYGSRFVNKQISPSTYRPIESSTVRPIAAINYNDLRVQPLYSRRSVAPPSRVPHKNYDDSRTDHLVHNNNLGNGYDPQFPQYDGISVNRGGFSYYLPKQYHEEDNSDPQRRKGGFGYIDPFGIRRVIYYNTSPEKGFEHRKNNRYVGHNATPYDPRPLK